MTIDPEKFEPQGVPTHEQVRVVWDAHPKPSSRKIAAIMTQRGFDISYRNIARWKKNGWREDLPPGPPTLASQGKARRPSGLKRAVKVDVPAETAAEAEKMKADGGLEAAVSGGKLTVDDYARIEKRIQALTPETKEKLLAEQEKARIIMNIIMMEEATRRAHVMVLIPKETGSFVGEINDAAGSLAPVAPIDHPPNHHQLNGDGAKVIEGRVNGPSPLSLKLKQLREDAVA